MQSWLASQARRGAYSVLERLADPDSFTGMYRARLEGGDDDGPSFQASLRR